MSALRNLVRDLVERRLWPVALVLVVALAAVPVVLGRSAPDAAPTAAVPAAPASGGAATSDGAKVTLDTSAPAARDRGPAARNPFKAPTAVRRAKATTVTVTKSTSGAATPAAPTSGSASATSGSTSGGTTTATPSSGTSSTSGTGSTSGSAKATTPATKPKTATTTAKPKAEDASDTYHVSVRFGVDGGATKTIRDIARLSPLPSVTDPFFVYLGVMETATTHEKRAVFLVSSDATPNGEGSCHPTKNDCESVELAVGQTAFFDYTPPSGTPIQYQLELAGIHKTAVVSDAKASAAFARHSVAGAELLGDSAKRNVRAAAGARAYRYLPAVGLLARAKRKHVTAKAAAAGTLIPGLALLSRKHQPGIPVWHSPKN
ncbi:MAG: hypothetical protein QOH72_1839 [Solirubrobacteraceae bacterium]|jgi:hypothetical protein|nr:hypothetical protein [Solirubrobacteraceae bacterium]